MSSPEFIIRSPEFNAPVDKPVSPLSKSVPIENPIQNSLSKVSDIGQIFSQELPIDEIKKARYEQWEATGQVPPITGGQEQRRRRRRRRPIESGDEPPGVGFANYLFDLQPNQARIQLSEILQQDHPDWDMKTVVRTVCDVELKYKMERHEILNKKYGESDERVIQLQKEVNFLKTLLEG